MDTGVLWQLWSRSLLLLAVMGSVCSAQIPSMFSNDGAAKATEVSGAVSVLKDGSPWAVQVGGLVQVNQVVVTGSDGFAVFQVTDGSTFEVYPNSRLTFRANPANWKDLLDVWLGRVKVHIEKLGGQPNLNRIKTPTAVISVRGTTFDIVVEDEASTLVSVEEGQVAVTHAVYPTKEPKLVNGGETLRVYKDQPFAKGPSPNRDAILQQGLRAVAEALYRIVYTPQSGASGSPLPGGGGRAPSGDTEKTAPPPPPPPPNGAPPPPGF